MITPIFSSTSLVPGILFGTLFAWFLASAAMTFLTGVKKPRLITIAPETGYVAPMTEAPPEQGVALETSSAAAASETPPEGSTPLPLIKGRPAQQHADPETASIAASADSR